jgi:hypothetical protein
LISHLVGSLDAVELGDSVVVLQPVDLIDPDLFHRFRIDLAVVVKVFRKFSWKN